MPLLSRILKSSAPLTLSSVPNGFLPWLMTDLARASTTRAVLICADDQAMRAVADAAHWFAPELQLIEFPAWDCLPYDRASPSLRASSERLAALAALQDKPRGSQLVLTTLNAATQRTLTPFRIRQLTATLAPGKAIDRDALGKLLQANGYVRTDTVADAGEYAVRGSLIDLYPSGSAHALRLDFFGDEIESIRAFDPADQRTISRIESFTLLPAAEALLDEASIKNFRRGYVALFGATATGDPLYQAVSEGRRLAGMDHWLPLFEEKLSTLFDHIGEGAVIVRDGGVAGAAASRFESITDYHANRIRTQTSDLGSYRPLAPDALYLPADVWDAHVSARPMHATSAFHAPDSDTTLDFGIDGPRDFAPERGRNENIYEVFGDYAAALSKAKQGLILACYTNGSRERLKGLLADHKLHNTAFADTWQEAQGLASTGKTALAVVPLDHGFITPQLALITEQILFGDQCELWRDEAVIERDDRERRFAC